jgi:hypothetical protein
MTKFIFRDENAILQAASRLAVATLEIAAARQPKQTALPVPPLDGKAAIAHLVAVLSAMAEAGLIDDGGPGG